LRILSKARIKSAAPTAYPTRAPANPDHARVVGRDRRDGVGRRELDIGLVQQQEAAVGQRVERGGDALPPVPRAHRVVGIGKVDQLGACFPCAVEQRGDILVIVAIGHLVQCAAETGHVVVEGRICPLRGDDCIARRHEKPHEVAQQPVDTFAHQHVFGRRVHVRGKGKAQVMAARVAVFPDIGYGLAHGVDGRGRRAEKILVGAETGGERLPPGALLFFGADERHGCGKGLDEVGVAWSCHAGR
jgi:hypothetical protein